MSFTIALAGNPNVGKSTLFNALTGSHQHVGNWPGKTVEKKEGRLQLDGQEILVVDLPGAYSLTAYSLEEVIARDYILDEQPAAVIAVVDASNLERNLYLVTQLIEMGKPVILVLNMTDTASSRGLKIDARRLGQGLGGIPVVETIGNRSVGLDQLKQAIRQVLRQPIAAPLPVPAQRALAVELAALEQQIVADPALCARYTPRWLATKLLENDSAVQEALTAQGARTLLQAAEAAQLRIEETTGEDAETLVVDQRYRFIGGVIQDALKRPTQVMLTKSDRIDQIVTHRIWGLPIFLLMMWVVFQFTANVSAPYLDWIDGFVNGNLYTWVSAALGALGLGGSWPAALLTDGIIAGVGGVVVFIPVLMSLYLALALLEDSGYMARAAFVMDRVMRLMGLHGKSFLPMIVGFGCTVPAVYATRTLENEKDRKLTGFLATFMSCGARLPVYVMIGTAFFGATAGNLVFAMYMLGIAVALVVGFGFKHTVYRGQPPAPFVMELPPYRLPRAGDVLRQMWRRTRGFLRKAGTIILGVSIVLWLLVAIPARPDAGRFNAVAPGDSLFGVASGWIAPVFKPAGFGTWQAAGSLLTGFMAKEVVIATMSQIYVGDEEAAAAVEPVNFPAELGAAALDFAKAAALTAQEILNIVPRTVNLLPFVNLPEISFFGDAAAAEDNTQLEAALVQSFTASAGSARAGQVAAIAFSVFVLLYVPCMTAVSAMRQEFGARWMWAQIGFTFTLAWIAAVLVFQVGRLVYT